MTPRDLHEAALARLAAWGDDDVTAYMRTCLAARAPRERETIKLDLTCPGVVGIIDARGARQLPEPRHAGFMDAVLLLQRHKLGSTPPCAAELCPGSPVPGAALRSRLRTVAAWLRGTAQCPELAEQLRPPVLSITDDADGTITFSPSVRFSVLLE